MPTRSSSRRIAGRQVLRDSRRPPGRGPRGSPPAGARRSARPSAGRPARSGRRAGPSPPRRPSGTPGCRGSAAPLKRLSLPLTTMSCPTCSRRSMNRRPNQVASIRPVSSVSSATVRWTRRRNSASTRMSATRPGARRPCRPPRSRSWRDRGAARAGRRSGAAGGRAGRGRRRARAGPGPAQERRRRQPRAGQRRREQLDRIGGGGGTGAAVRATGYSVRRTALLGRDEVSVVGLAAVADLDLDVPGERRRSASRPPPPRRGRRRRRRRGSRARSRAGAPRPRTGPPCRRSPATATRPSSGSSAIVWPRLTLRPPIVASRTASVTATVWMARAASVIGPAFAPASRFGSRASSAAKPSAALRVGTTTTGRSLIAPPGARRGRRSGCWAGRGPRARRPLDGLEELAGARVRALAAVHDRRHPEVAEDRREALARRRPR